MDVLMNNSMLMLQKSMDYVWQKQRVISENIANVDTPGYKAKFVVFEDELRRKLEGADISFSRKESVKEAIRSSVPILRDTPNETMRLDGNNVNIDAENVELARAQLNYDFLSRQINDQFMRLRTIITSR